MTEQASALRSNASAETATLPRTPIVLGMWIFLASEAMFFLMLVLVFFYFRASADPALLAGSSLLDVSRSGLFTMLLIASSGTLWLAERSAKRNGRRGLRIWLLATVALGSVFLLGQAMEYAGLHSQGLTISADLFGTQFYTLTGIHFLHVTAGVVALAILAYLALRGNSNEPGARAIGPIALYWHFVDVVWIVLFSVIYLMGA